MPYLSAGFNMNQNSLAHGPPLREGRAMTKPGAFHSVATLDNALIFRSGINFNWLLLLAELMNCSKGLWMWHLGT